jgi:hypothetical protein
MADISIADVLNEYVRRLHEAEVSDRKWGAQTRLAERLGIHKQSMGQILLGNPDRAVTLGHLDSMRINEARYASDVLIELLQVAVEMERDVLLRMRKRRG